MTNYGVGGCRMIFWRFLKQGASGLKIKGYVDIFLEIFFWKLNQKKTGGSKLNRSGVFSENFFFL